VLHGRQAGLRSLSAQEPMFKGPREDEPKRLAVRRPAYRTSTPEEFARIIQSDVAKWSKLVKEANIKAE
jgi:hypothetical protein